MFVVQAAAMAAWHATREQVTQELQLSRHRASNDARILQQTLLRTMGQRLPH